jgi:hypothetical protein
MALDIDTLAHAGRLIAGDNWQTALGRALAPFRADGVSAPLDDSLMRKWKRGDRPVPAWATPAIAQLLMQRAEELEEQAREARELAARLSPGVTVSRR